jgi:putative ABC transport system permease protein
MLMLLHDFRHALRWLRSNPGFSAGALVVLGLAIGAATATFTVVHAVLLRPLPFEAPDRVIRIWSSPAGRDLPFFSVSAPDVEDWRARAATLERVAPYDRQTPFALAGRDGVEEVIGAKVSRELFELFGVPPAVGRWFSEAEDRPASGARVVVIGHGAWQRRLGGRQDVIGHTLRLDDESWTVIGVMPFGFAIPNNPAEIWLPLQLAADPAKRDERRLRVLARLGDGAGVEQATAELTRIASDLEREHPKTNRAWTVTVRPLTETVVSETFRRALLIIAGGVALVVLIACANLAGLLLSRATGRGREIAVRTALGASRAALVCQLLTESLMLAAIGGALGVLVAVWALDALAALAVTSIPRADEIALRPEVMLFACGLTTFTAIAFGLIPALGASRGRLEALRVRDVAGGRGTSRARDLLVVGEVAVAMVLLVGAGLMLRSFVQLQQRELGFVAENLLVVDVAPPGGTPPASFYEGLVQRLGALPGVTSAAAGSSLPFAGPNSSNIVAIEGRPFAEGEAPDTDLRVVSADYFRTLGIPVMRGRTFTSADTDAAPALVISATSARRFFPNEDPVGRRIKIGDAPWTTIVGVVGDARYLALDDPRNETRPMVYFPPALKQPSRGSMTMALRTAVAPETLIGAVRNVVTAVAPRQPMSRADSMDHILAAERGPQRFSATLLAAFAWIALVLAAAGLWALIAHVVARRTHEIGIRVALGAHPGDVLRMTAGRGMALAVAGIALGLAASAAATRVLQRVLFDVSPTDPATFAGIAALFLVVAATASMLPARRALRIDPAEALRLE